MVEPSRANGHVDLRRIPEQLGGFFKHSAASKIFRLTENAQSFVAFFRTGIHTGSQYCGAPFRLTSQSSFIAYPAHIIAHDSHYGFRLQTKAVMRSEEHTSELQSRQYLVCRLLLEKKKYILTFTPS